jgi:[CysO sulfur-carrier protein]-S-L-cysteine hydrolase
MKTINLPRHIVNRLLTLAQQDATIETCGLISAIDSTPAHVYPVENIASDKQRLFEMKPAEQIAAMKSMRDSGESLFAIYHSHPHAPAEPSLLDIQQANYSDVVYLIISLNTKGVLEMKGFYLQDDKFDVVELVYI